MSKTNNLAKRWSDEDIKRAYSMQTEGQEIDKIAAELGRSTSAVIQFFARAKKRPEKVSKVREHVRIKGRPKRHKTLYCVMVPRTQDDTVKHLLTALGCCFRKVGFDA